MASINQKKNFYVKTPCKVGGIHADNNAGFTKPTTSEHNVGRLDQVAGRPWILFQEEWSNAVAHNNYYLFDGREKSWENFLNNFCYVKCDLELTFKVNGTNFHQGVFVVAYIPNPFDRLEQADHTHVRSMPVQEMMGYQHVKLNACGSSEQTMVIPWNQTREMMYKYQTLGSPTNLDARGNFLGMLITTPLNRLEASTCATPTLTVTCWIKPTNIYASGYSYIPSQPVQIPGVPQAIGDDIEGVVGTISSTVKTVTGIADALIEHGILDNPDRKDLPTSWIRKTASGWSYGVGMENSARLTSYEGGQNRLMDHDHYGRTTLSQYCQRFGLLKQATIDGTLNENSLVCSFPVSPHVCDGFYRDSPDFVTTLKHIPVSFAAYPFQYWRGSMVYKLQVVASGFQQSVIAVAWVPDAPNTDTPGGYLGNVTRLHVAMVEVKGCTEYEFKIPFLSQYNAKIHDSPWADYTTADGWPDTTAHQRRDSYNGRVEIYIVNRFISPCNVVPSGVINIFARGGDDLELAVPNGLAMLSAISGDLDETHNSPLPIPPILYRDPKDILKQDVSKFQSLLANVHNENKNLKDHLDGLLKEYPKSVREEFQNDACEIGTAADDCDDRVSQLQSDVDKLLAICEEQSKKEEEEMSTEVGEDEGVTATDTPQHPALEEEKGEHELGAQPLVLTMPKSTLKEQFGESHMDLSKILKRYVHMGEVIQTSTGSRIMRLAIPVTPCLWPWNFRAGSGLFIDHSSTLLNHFSSMFAYWSGSLRFKFMLRDNSSSPNLSFQSAHFRPISMLKNEFDIGDQLADTEAGIYRVVWQDVVADPPTFFSRSAERGASIWGQYVEQTCQQGTLEVTVPFISHRRRLATTRGAPHAEFDGQDVRYAYYPYGSVSGILELDISANAGSNAAYTVDTWMAAGDDFQLSVPIGPPRTNVLYLSKVV